MTAVVQKMKAQNILKVAPFSPSFISPFFLVPKSDGSARPIFNLKALNEFVRVYQFRLVNMHRIPNFLQPQDWMCKIDLSQAYFHLKISKVHRRFLRLIYDGELLEMTCLPFGLGKAPRTFSILTNWIAQNLRQREIRILVYDFIIANQNVVTLQDHVQITLGMLQALGWSINLDKSVTTTQKGLTYLGIPWRTWDNLKSLPKEKNRISGGKGGPDPTPESGDSKRSSEPRGSAKLCQLHSTTWPITTSSVLKISEQPTSSSNKNKSRSIRTQMVESERSSLIKAVFPPSFSLSCNRRIRSCLGCSAKPLLSGLWSPTGAKSALQSEGDACNSTRLSNTCTDVESKLGFNSVRQQDCSGGSVKRGEQNQWY